MAPMGFLSWLGLRPPTPLQLESPWADPDILTRITWNELWPEAEAWMPMTRAQAMAVPAVAAARHRIVGTLSRLPLVAKDLDGTKWDRAVALLTQPDDTQPHTATMAWTLDDILFHGHAWWLVVKAYGSDTDARPRPASVVHVPVSSVGADGHLDHTFTEWLAGRGLAPLTHPQNTGYPWLIYFPGPHEGILSFGCQAIRAAANMERAAGHAADNPVPSVELHQISGTALSPAEIDELTRRWADARRGRNGGVAFTNAAVEARMHGAADAQLLVDGRNQAAVDIARLAGIPASAIDAGMPGTAITYANLVDRVFDLINFGLSPYASAVTARLSMDDVMPHGVSVSFDYSTLYPAQTANAPEGATTQRENQP